MATVPTQEQLRAALADAGNAHHEYESSVLRGARDEQWAGWYAAYVLGRLGHFAMPSLLTQWLESVTSAGDWPKEAAALVLSKARTD